MHVRFPPTALVIATVTLASFAHAQTQPTESGNAEPEVGSDSLTDIVAPKALDTHVEIPVEPTKLQTVLLELTVSDQGTVDHAVVISGEEPFAQATLSASSRFRFEPAKVHGRKTAAKIRFLVRFAPQELEPAPARPPEPARPGNSPKSAMAPSPAKAVPTEVVVVGVRPAYTTSTVTRAEAREVPGTFGDPLRAVESTPGITPIFSGVPFFFVRGAPPGNVGYFLDGIKVPMLYHAFLGPSVVHPALIEHVDVFRGAPSARFGRYGGAIISAETRDSLPRAGGEANVRLFDAGLLAETPFAQGKGHVLAGGRYSYTALAASLITGADLEYWDYQTRADIATSKNSRLGVFALGAYDSATVNYDDEDQGGGMQYHRIDLRHDIESGPVTSRVAATVGYDKTDSNSATLSNRLLAVRTQNEYRISPEASLGFGGDVEADRFRLDVDETTAEADDVKALFPTRTDITGGVYGELSVRPIRWAIVAPGVRVDGYRINERTASSVDPRLAVTFTPHPRLFTGYTIGLMHQAPNYIPQVPAAQVGTLEGGLQRTLSASSTVGVHLPFDLLAQATGYRVAFFELLDPIGRSGEILSFDPNNLRHRERGSSIGLELELKRPMSRRIGGFVGITLSRTERSDGTRESLSAYDRPLVLTSALGIDLGRNFRAGAKVVYYSGIPGLELVSGEEPYYSGKHRGDAFFRADLRFEKRWAIAGRGYWALVAEMLNATMSQEMTKVTCSPSTCIRERSGPLAIPSVGVELYSY